MSVHAGKSDKQSEFRRYLVGSGIADALLAFFKSLRKSNERVEDGMAVLKAHFGEYRHPASDVSERLGREMIELNERLAVALSREADLQAQVSLLDRTLVSKKLDVRLAYKTRDVPREVLLKAMLGATAAKKTNPQLLAVIPKLVNLDRLAKFITSTDIAGTVAKPWVEKPAEEPVWENVAPSEDMVKFWKMYTEFTV